jgi:nitrile hydratase accessory protein
MVVLELRTVASSGNQSSAIAPLAGRDGEPAFAEPWQAEVLALAMALCERGAFSAAAWSEALGAELRRAEAAGARDDHDAYYGAVLAALERLLAADVGAAALAARAEEWRRAYLRTPHGQPVELAAKASG